MITGALIFSAIVIPFVSVVFLRLYENQLVRQAEGELIGQAAILAAVYEHAIEAAPEDAFPAGAVRPSHDPAVADDERYAPIVPALDLTSSPILAPRPRPLDPSEPPTPQAIRVGDALGLVMQSAQRTTLAGFRLLDARGAVVAGRDDVGRSFAHVAEVREAMAGRFSAVMRQRDEEVPQPPLYSISRGTNVRVFVAMPVFVGGRVRGVVYVSRTPDNILRQLYQERFKVAIAALMVLAASSLIGIAFVRTIARPIGDLAGRAETIARGGRDAIGPLEHYGTQELHSLAQSLMTMARRLSDRSEYLSTFATHVSHELKTPLTSLRGAAELMRDAADSMTPEDRRRFLSNMLADAERMILLLDQLRELARADNPRLGGSVMLSEVVSALRARFEGLSIERRGEDLKLAMSAENAGIVFGNLLDNSARHGARQVEIAAGAEVGAARIAVSDDGEGVSPGNRARLFEPFFTTRRAEGGTGMGLGIVDALVRAHGGSIALAESERGARFVLEIPLDLPAAAPTRGWFARILRKSS